MPGMHRTPGIAHIEPGGIPDCLSIEEAKGRGERLGPPGEPPVSHHRCRNRRNFVE
jgi:hypothetical protein